MGSIAPHVFSGAGENVLSAADAPHGEGDGVDIAMEEEGGAAGGAVVDNPDVNDDADIVAVEDDDDNDGQGASKIRHQDAKGQQPRISARMRAAMEEDGKFTLRAREVEQKEREALEAKDKNFVDDIETKAQNDINRARRKQQDRMERALARQKKSEAEKGAVAAASATSLAFGEYTPKIDPKLAAEFFGFEILSSEDGDLNGNGADISDPKPLKVKPNPLLGHSQPAKYPVKQEKRSEREEEEEEEEDAKSASSSDVDAATILARARERLAKKKLKKQMKRKKRKDRKRKRDEGMEVANSSRKRLRASKKRYDTIDLGDTTESGSEDRPRLAGMESSESDIEVLDGEGRMGAVAGVFKQRIAQLNLLKQRRRVERISAEAVAVFVASPMQPDSEPEKRFLRPVKRVMLKAAAAAAVPASPVADEVQAKLKLKFVSEGRDKPVLVSVYKSTSVQVMLDGLQRKFPNLEGFRFEGDRLELTDTVGTLDLEDEDQIDMILK